MNMMALDMSTGRASMALLDEDTVFGYAEWVEQRNAGQPLFQHVQQLMEDAGWDWGMIDAYGVGRGPGMYSGLRISITALQALALPDDKPVYAISSGAVVAQQVLTNGVQGPVAVVGDARRGQLWYGVFDLDGCGLPRLQGGWQLTEWAQFSQVTEGVPVKVSADWDRLSGMEAFEQIDRQGWLQQAVVPRADVLGRLLLNMRRCGLETEEVLPVYMHPPVADKK